MITAHSNSKQKHGHCHQTILKFLQLSVTQSTVTSIQYHKMSVTLSQMLEECISTMQYTVTQHNSNSPSHRHTHTHTHTAGGGREGEREGGSKTNATTSNLPSSQFLLIPPWHRERCRGGIFVYGTHIFYSSQFTGSGKIR